jgi:hypothetical protein
MEGFVDCLMRIEKVDDEGVAQVLCDIGYLVNVVSALEMEVGERLGWVAGFLEMGVDEVAGIECGGRRGEIRDWVVAVRKIV